MKRARPAGGRTRRGRVAGRAGLLLLPALFGPAAGQDVISALKEKGASIRPLGERGGLAGHLVTLSGGESYTLYLTPDGHAVAGLLYDPGGGLVTSRQLAGSPPATAAPRDGAQPAGPGSAAALFRDTLSAFGFTIGARGPIVAVFADPGCRWSSATVAALAGEARRGEIRLRVVPLGLLGGTSAARAAAVASSSDPAAAWFDPAQASEPRPDGALAVERNDWIFDRWRKGGVPLILWRRPADGRIGWRVGDVGDARRWLRRTFRPGEENGG